MDGQSSQDQGNGGAQVGQAGPAGMPSAQLTPAGADVIDPNLEEKVEAEMDVPAHSTIPGLPPTVQLTTSAGAPAMPAAPLPTPAQAPPTAPQAAAPPAARATDYNAQAMAPPGTPDVPLPQEAADGDVIEKEWVDKAKHIVEKTAMDPYEQVRSLNTLRAEYMKKRYNKDVVLPDV